MSVLSSVAVATLRVLPNRMARNICKSVPFEHDVDVDGIWLRCHPHDNVTERGLILEPMTSEGQGPGLVMAGISDGDTFVDIGANSGLYSLLAARRVGPGGRVLAIEPIPLMQQRIRFNAALNGFGNIEVASVAVGEIAGDAVLYVRRANYGESCFSPSPGFEPITVPVRRLSDIVAEHRITRIDALKIDVEGFEDRALLPFFRSTSDTLWPRRMLIEIAWANRWREDCLGVLTSLGYRQEWVSADGADAILARAT